MDIDLDSDLPISVTDKDIVNASYINDGSSNNHKIRVNGAEESMTTAKDLEVGKRAQLAMAARQVPVNNSRYANGWAGNITEVVGFESQLTTAQSETMEKNMAAHYNITLA